MGHHHERFTVQCENTRKPDQHAVIITFSDHATAIFKIDVRDRE